MDKQMEQDQVEQTTQVNEETKTPETVEEKPTKKQQTNSDDTPF